MVSCGLYNDSTVQEIKPTSLIIMNLSVVWSCDELVNSKLYLKLKIDPLSSNEEFPLETACFKQENVSKN